MQPFAIKPELRIASFERGLRRDIFFWRPVAAIPQQHGAPAILTLRDGPLKVAVVERVIFDFDRQPFVMRV